MKKISVIAAATLLAASTSIVFAQSAQDTPASGKNVGGTTAPRSHDSSMHNKTTGSSMKKSTGNPAAGGNNGNSMGGSNSDTNPGTAAKGAGSGG